MGVVVFWVACVAAVVIVHKPAIEASVAAVAVTWCAFRDASAGIRRNALTQPAGGPGRR